MYINNNRNGNFQISKAPLERQATNQRDIQNKG